MILVLTSTKGTEKHLSKTFTYVTIWNIYFFVCLFFIYSIRILLTRMMSHSLKFRFSCDVKLLPLKHTCNFPFTLASLLLCLLNKHDFWLTQTWKLNFTSFFILTLLTSEWKCTHYWHYRYYVISKKHNTSVTQIALIFRRHFLKGFVWPSINEIVIVTTVKILLTYGSILILYVRIYVGNCRMPTQVKKTVSKYH